MLHAGRRRRCSPRTSQHDRRVLAARPPAPWLRHGGIRADRRGQLRALRAAPHGEGRDPADRPLLQTTSSNTTDSLPGSPDGFSNYLFVRSDAREALRRRPAAGRCRRKMVLPVCRSRATSVYAPGPRSCAAPATSRHARAGTRPTSPTYVREGERTEHATRSTSAEHLSGGGPCPAVAVSATGDAAPALVARRRAPSTVRRTRRLPGEERFARRAQSRKGSKSIPSSPPAERTASA